MQNNKKSLFIIGPIKSMLAYAEKGIINARKYYESLGYVVSDCTEACRIHIENSKECENYMPNELEKLCYAALTMNVCDAVILLDNWEIERDSRFLALLAEFYGKPIFEAFTDDNIGIHFKMPMKYDILLGAYKLRDFTGNIPPEKLKDDYRYFKIVFGTSAKYIKSNTRSCQMILISSDQDPAIGNYDRPYPIEEENEFLVISQETYEGIFIQASKKIGIKADN